MKGFSVQSPKLALVEVVIVMNLTKKGKRLGVQKVKSKTTNEREKKNKNIKRQQ